MLIMYPRCEAYDTNPELFDLTVPCQPEGNLVLKMWGRIIEILFSTSKSISYISGDTVLKDLFVNFKVDFRLGVVLNGSFVDIANVEVGKFSNSKIQDDHMKVVLEAKAIINGIISKYHFIKPTEVNVFSLQACGLKGDLLCTSMFDLKKYGTPRVSDRLRVPLVPHSKKVLDLMEKLDFFKKHVEQVGEFVKEQINEALDRRSSFGKTLGPGFKASSTFGDWLDIVTLDS